VVGSIPTVSTAKEDSPQRHKEYKGRQRILYSSPAFVSFVSLWRIDWFGSAC
jgi:hypothetical protein